MYFDHERVLDRILICDHFSVGGYGKLGLTCTRSSAENVLINLKIFILFFIFSAMEIFMQHF